MKTASRAEYGKHVIEVASAALTEEFGKGFSKTSIKNCKKFFMYFSHPEKGQAVPDQFKTKAYQQDKLEYIKSPVVLEFLGLPEDTSLAESKELEIILKDTPSSSVFFIYPTLLDDDIIIRIIRNKDAIHRQEDISFLQVSEKNLSFCQPIQ